MLYAFVSRSDRITRRPSKKMLVATDSVSLMASITALMATAIRVSATNGYTPLVYNIEIGQVEE